MLLAENYSLLAYGDEWEGITLDLREIENKEINKRLSLCLNKILLVSIHPHFVSCTSTKWDLGRSHHIHLGHGRVQPRSTARQQRSQMSPFVHQPPWQNHKDIPLVQVFLCQSRSLFSGYNIQLCEWSLPPWWSSCSDRRCDFDRLQRMIQLCKIDHYWEWFQVSKPIHLSTLLSGWSDSLSHFHRKALVSMEHTTCLQSECLRMFQQFFSFRW